MDTTIVGPLPPFGGGVGTYALRLAEGLAKKGDIDMISYASAYPDFLYKGSLEKGRQQPNGVSTNFLIRWYNPLTWILSGILPKTKIVHFHWWSYRLFPLFFPLLVALKIRRKKIVCTAHNILEYETNGIDRIIRRIVFRFPDTIIVHSEENKKELHTRFHIPLEKITVIPMGIFDVYGPVMEKTKARKLLNLPEKGKIVLFFGQIRAYKGVDDLITAFLSVPNAHLVIAGRPWTPWSVYEQQIRTLGIRNIIARPSFIPDREVAAYFSAADLIVLPYRNFDAQSAVGNIAISFGKPLLVTDTGGLTHLVKDKQAIVPASSPEHLGKAMNAILSSPRVLSSLANDSLDLQKSYSWDRVAEMTVRTYKALLGRGL